MSHVSKKHPSRLAYITPVLGPVLGSLLLAGCSNLVPGPYIDPPPPDAGPKVEDMRTPERTGKLRVSPGFQQQLTITDGTPATATWKAFLHYDDTGEDVEVSDTCFWSLVGRDGQRTPLGSIDRGRFTSTPLSAGVGKVRAELMGMRAEGDLSIKLTATRLSTTDDSSGPAADAPTRFSGAMTATKVPRLQYPPDGAVLPANLGGLLVQWSASGGADLHEVRFQADLLDLRIYTTSPRRLSLSETDLTLLTDAGLYGPVTVTVRGGNQTGADTSYGVSSTSTLRAATAPSGATYYFSTATPAQGVWRYGWGAAFGASAAPYATQQTAATGNRCIGCHALSADGGYMIVSHDMTTLGTGSFIDVKFGMTRFVSSTLKWFSAALSGDSLTAILSGGGALNLVQTQIGSGPVVVPSGVTTGVTIPVMPTLTPDGKRLVFVRGRQVAGLSEAHVYGGTIAVADQQNGAFAAPTDVVTAAGNDNNYYPALSPDGKWILFNRTSNATASLADSYDNLTAALYAVPVDRSRQPIRLNLANDSFLAQFPTNAAIATNLSNSYPSFLPGSAQMDGHTVYFFTFASRRHYGGEILRNGSTPRASTTVVRGKITPAQDVTLSAWNQQLWIAVFDPDKAALGLDPTAAALWVPFQTATSSNHTAVSAQTLVGPAL